MVQSVRNFRFWRIASLGLVAGNIRLRTNSEAGEPLLAPIYEVTACFRKWRSIVFTAGGSRRGWRNAISSRILPASALWFTN